MTKKRNLRLNFRLKKIDSVIIAGVSCLLIFVLVLFGAYAQTVRESEEGLISLVLERMSSNQKIHFESFIEEKVEVLEALAKYPEVYHMEDESLKSFLKGKAKNFGYQYFFVMKADGTGFYLDEGSGVYRDQKNEPFFQSIMANDTYLTEPFYTDKGPAITTVCVSIKDWNGKKVGVLCGALNLETIQNMIKESDLVLDGDSYILNSSGNYIAVNGDVSNVNRESSIFNEVDSQLDLIRKSFLERTDKSGNLVLKGTEYTAHVTYLSHFNWVLVQAIPRSEVTARFQYMESLQAIMVVLTLGLFACIIRIIYSWRRSDKKIYTDPLTGCNSRAACLSLIESLEDNRNIRLSVVYMDLNKFKYVNDTFGHDEGDRLLRIFGSTLNKILGSAGFVGRMGGDEFIAILADIGDEEIEKLCQDVEATLWDKSKSLPFPYIISASYGYASRNVGGPETIDEIMQQADGCMYVQKERRKSQEQNQK